MPEIKELVAQLGRDQKTAYVARLQLLQIVTRANAPGEEAKRAEVAGALVAELNATGEPKKNKKGEDIPPGLLHSSAIRTKIAYLLSYVAAGAEVPALEEATRDFEVREAARYALDQNTSEAATRALIAILDQRVGPEFRVGVVNALARRNGPEVLAVLRKTATDDSDDEVRIAAVEGLSYFADPGNDAVIAHAAADECPRIRTRAQKARVRLAEQLQRAGQAAAAAKIYHAIQSGNADQPQKTAAALGLKPQPAKARA